MCPKVLYDTQTNKLRVTEPLDSAGPDPNNQDYSYKAELAMLALCTAVHSSVQLTSASAMALRMAGPGRVTVSLRRSTWSHPHIENKPGPHLLLPTAGGRRGVIHLRGLMAV
jgi:hypothetical protein